MGLVAVLAAVLLVSLATVINTAPGQSLRISHSVCSTVKFDPGEQEHQVAETILKELCETGLRHVVQEQRRPRGGEQFAIINLHRDASSERVRWQEGDAKSVVDDSDWRVDEEEALVPGKGRNTATRKTFYSYHWYLHGLPMWPLLNQTLKKNNFFFSLRKVKWPNYALATPLYLVPYERRNYRNETISINKMFQKMGNKKHKAFKDTVRFKKYVTKFCRKTCDSIERNPDRLNNWLVPLIDHSLTHMMESLKNGGRCPDQLYVFFLREPCRHDSLLLKEKIDDLLRRERCLDITRLVIGYSAKVPPSAC